MESLVKEVNIRVKGTEKFWDDGASGEAILRIRAAALCDNARFMTFLYNHPGTPSALTPPDPQLPSPRKRARSCAPASLHCNAGLAASLAFS